MLALGVFGSVAFVLCAAGLYAVVALTSRMRRREYAIRMALGAGRGGVRWLVLRQALIVGGAGTFAGLGAAAAATRSLEGMLHGVTPIDPGTFAIAAMALLLLAVLAAWHPARHAERVDPVEALRMD
jgi:ABC-type antimicrobial peptide transport system permease subunit